MGKYKPRNQAHEDFIGRLRQEHERRTGHTPTESEQRQIEDRANKFGDEYDRKKGGK